MPRPATGTIIERRNASGEITRLIRFPVNGQKRTIALGVVTRADAEQRLAQEFADVQRGTWTPPEPVVSPRADVPSFHEFAEEWWTLNEDEWAENTKLDYRLRLEKHLLKFFGELPLDAITIDSIDRYRAEKLKAALSPRSVNMTLTLLGAILESAFNRELVARNVAKGRRAKERAPRRSYLQSPQQIEALPDAAAELDRGAARDRRHLHRRAMIATLTFAGLRITELLALRWRDVDLASGWLTVGDAKTDAGRRRVKIRGALRDELAVARAKSGGEGYVFPTRSGKRLRPETSGAASWPAP